MEKGIKQQLAEFRDKGIYGFTIQARMGLPKTIAYMGKRWLELFKYAVDEAARHDMTVHLYDEGMYPSGSAHGEVVEGHPEFLARGLEMRKIEPSDELELGEQEKCIAIMPEGENRAIPVLNPPSPLFQRGNDELSFQREKPYYAFVITPSGGTIRGVHEGEEDRQPDAPKASDLLNPLAMKRFIELTHERYYQTLKEHFGNTIQAMFTDEPSIMGRGSKGGLKHWTDGLEEDFHKEKGYNIIPLLPALWNDMGDITAQVRRDHSDVVAKRFNESFYQQISDWCADHNIALTGHPAESDDIGPLRYFQLPGQDMVWRYVEPEKPTALEGRHSTAGKCSSSAARHQKARRNGNEVYGAYGWKLNMDEMKWLADWFMVRGVNLFWPHAFYYSVRGSRAHERPPDLGMNNLWWEHYRIFADYTRRLCWLLTDSEQVCEIAILGSHNHLPWEPAKLLYQNQYDFNYLEDRLFGEAYIENGKLNIGESSYSVIIRMPDHHLSECQEEILKRFINSGGQVMAFSVAERLLNQLTGINSDVMIEPANDDLRYVHVKKDGYDFYYLVNEGGNAIDTKLTINTVGSAEWWDPLTGKSSACPILDKTNKTMTVPLHLEKRESIILSIEPNKLPIVETNWQPPQILERIDISSDWRLYDPESGGTLSDKLTDWTDISGYEKFSGILSYERVFEATSYMLEDAQWILDLGEVHDFAEVYCNGVNCGVKLWGSFRFALNLKPGKNVLRVNVTNSLANKFEKESVRSGIYGPVLMEKQDKTS